MRRRDAIAVRSPCERDANARRERARPSSAARASRVAARENHETAIRDRDIFHPSRRAVGPSVARARRGARDHHTAIDRIHSHIIRRKKRKKRKARVTFGHMAYT
jgi:ribonucleotide reductase alpha subunit